jgi:hypothetical protein
MADILEEASALIQCRECSWYRTCVLPVRFSLEDVRRQLEAASPGQPPPELTQPAAYHLLSGMVSAAQNTMLEGCPVFIHRLKNNPRLAERIKRIMREWSAEEDSAESSGD